MAKAKSNARANGETEARRGRKTAKKGNGAKGRAARLETLRAFVRNRGAKFLDDPNVTSIGIAQKDDGEYMLQFTVGTKSDDKDTLESLNTTVLPKKIAVNGFEVETDVVQRSYRTSAELVKKPSPKDGRKTRLNPIMPGISVSHPKGTAGTLGAIVYDAHTGAPCILSNWHVLHTDLGSLGDHVVQPGPYDDNRVAQNDAGVLLRSHLGAAGDCAIARVEGRACDPKVRDLGVPIKAIAKPELGDIVVKSGRTTGVTLGKVRRVDVMAKITYPGVGPKQIGGFEIGPPDHSPSGYEVSMGGDSGSAWLVGKKKSGKAAATDVMVGLHFAGNTDADQDEHALACYAHSVFEKLEITPQPPKADEAAAIEKLTPAGSGYEREFLGVRVDAPILSTTEKKKDAVVVHQSHLIPYTHFSVCVSKSRRFANFVAWNIDGDRLKKIDRKGLKFRIDPRVPEKYQVGDDVYVNNKLDRGHVARRADLVWGSKAEAQRGNYDSFYFTNITPQHERYNQSERHGLWGELENAIYEDVEVERSRLSLAGGPIFDDDDPEYRGIQIPRSFWKVIAYIDGEDGALKAKAYVLTQNNLLDDLEAFELDPFRMYQVSLTELQKMTGLSFDSLKGADTFEHVGPEAVGGREVREVRSREELIV